MAAKDSILNTILRATDDALNANPLRQVIPVNGAEIARALRTVWLRAICRPERAVAATADFNMKRVSIPDLLHRLVTQIVAQPGMPREHDRKLGAGALDQLDQAFDTNGIME
jgi:hypothetical protein